MTADSDLPVPAPPCPCESFRTKPNVGRTYYAFGFNKWTTLTFDYQLIGNPGYNADRGPGVALLRAISCRVLRTLPLPPDFDTCGINYPFVST
jgi:hypothetical protein